MRHLLEYITGAVNNPLKGDLGQVSISKEIVRMFGIGADIKEKATGKQDFDKSEKEIEGYVEEVKKLKNIGLSRLIVRDAFPDEDTVTLWESLGSDLHYTEYKAENTLDRLTSAANPRFIERVVEGSKFNFEMVYTAYSDTDGNFTELVNKDVQAIFTGLRLLEASAIGKSGSRGYGKIAFHLDQPLWVLPEDYKSGEGNWLKSKASIGENLTGLDELELNAIKHPSDAV